MMKVSLFIHQNRKFLVFFLIMLRGTFFASDNEIRYSRRKMDDICQLASILKIQTDFFIDKKIDNVQLLKEERVRAYGFQIVFVSKQRFANRKRIDIVDERNNTIIAQGEIEVHNSNRAAITSLLSNLSNTTMFLPFRAKSLTTHANVGDICINDTVYNYEKKDYCTVFYFIRQGTIVTLVPASKEIDLLEIAKVVDKMIINALKEGSINEDTP